MNCTVSLVHIPRSRFNDNVLRGVCAHDVPNNRVSSSRSRRAYWCTAAGSSGKGALLLDSRRTATSLQPAPAAQKVTCRLDVADALLLGGDGSRRSRIVAWAIGATRANEPPHLQSELLPLGDAGGCEYGQFLWACM